MAKSYVVTAPLVLVRDEAGATQYLYKGAPVPSYVTGDALKNLDGLIGENLIAQPTEPPAARVMAAGDDPADFKVEEVQAYLAGADDAEKARVLEAEAAGKDRKGLTGS